MNMQLMYCRIWIQVSRRLHWVPASFYAREDGIDVPPDMLAQSGRELDPEDGYALEAYRDLVKKSRAIA